MPPDRLGPGVYVEEEPALPGPVREALHRIAEHERCLVELRERASLGGMEAARAGTPVLLRGHGAAGAVRAARALAGALGRSLFQVDLAAVVSTYIGETEENLERILAGAETAGVLLLFDDADALFGGRGEARRTPGRTARIDVAFLLQRLERHPGLAVLAVGPKARLGDALLRRFAFVVDLPRPVRGPR